MTDWETVSKQVLCYSLLNLQPGKTARKRLLPMKNIVNLDIFISFIFLGPRKFWAKLKNQRGNQYPLYIQSAFTIMLNLGIFSF